MKQAVILVHGMGEQVPMETLRGFVETMWVRNPNIAASEPGDPPESGNPVWWKPDPRTNSFELSRVTTRNGHKQASGHEIDEPDPIKGQRVDFFEFYWADLTSNNTVGQLKDWLFSLLFRRLDQVPGPIAAIWSILWVATALFFGLTAWKTIASFYSAKLPDSVAVTIAVGSAFVALISGFIISTFGDVAHYVRAKPANIAARQAIRDRGLSLLRNISDSGEYNRIVVVGHSLGSIIAYDLIKLFWSERGEARKMIPGDDVFEAFKRCERAGEALRSGNSDKTLLGTFRAKQSQVFKTMLKRTDFPAIREARLQNRPSANTAEEKPWLISDFITVGSPLTYAQILFAHNREAFDIGVAERRFPVSPPVRDPSRPNDVAPYGYVYQVQAGQLSAHHAAPFAAVRWSNIYDDGYLLLFGDMVSGSAHENFGRGIREHRVMIRRLQSPLLAPRRFTHTCYWSNFEARSAHLDTLSGELDLTWSP